MRNNDKIIVGKFTFNEKTSFIKISFFEHQGKVFFHLHFTLHNFFDNPKLFDFIKKFEDDTKIRIRLKEVRINLKTGTSVYLTGNIYNVEENFDKTIQSLIKYSEFTFTKTSISDIKKEIVLKRL